MSDRFTIDLEELLSLAFYAGFEASGEGYNGEYPFNYDENSIRRELAAQRKLAVKEILASLHVSQEPPQ